MCTIFCGQIRILIVIKLVIFFHALNNFISKYLILLLNDNSIPLICSGIDYFTISYITIKQEGNVERIAELVLFQNILYYY